MNTEMGSVGLAERIASEINYEHGTATETLELIEFLSQRVGNSLLWVATYDDSHETVYLHSASENTADADVPDIVAQLRGVAPAGFSSPYDELRATVHLFEDAVVVHLPQGDSCGVTVGFEPDVARILRGFIDDCELYL